MRGVAILSEVDVILSEGDVILSEGDVILSEAKDLSATLRSLRSPSLGGSGQALRMTDWSSP